MNVILVDHIDSSRAILRHLLECVDLHLTLHEFDDPESALDWCIDYRPDAVVIDNNLPAMSGIDFAKQFRLQPEHRTVPILLVTMADDAHAHNSAVHGGIAELLLKPLRAPDAIARLTRVLQERLGHKQRHSTAGSHPTAGTLRKRVQAVWDDVQGQLRHAPTTPQLRSSRAAHGDSRQRSHEPGELSAPDERVVPIRGRLRKKPNDT